MLKKIGGILILIMVSGFVAAQEEALEMLLFEEIPLVISSTLTEQKIEDAPSIMSVVTEKQIETRGYRTFIDIFRDVAGLTLKPVATGEMIFSFRGTSTYRYKVLLNGLDLVSVANGGNHMWSEMPVEIIKQVEIIRGPGGALYGGQAFDGVINILTKKNPDASNVSASVYGGNEDYVGGSINVNLAGEEDWLVLNANYAESNLYNFSLDYDVLPSLISLAPGEYTPDSERSQIIGSFSLKGFEGDFSYIDYQTDAAFGPLPNFLDDNDNHQLYESWLVNVKKDFHFSDNFSLTPRVSYRFENYANGGSRLFINKNFMLPVDTDFDGNNEFFPQGVVVGYDVESSKFEFELLGKLELDSSRLTFGFVHEKLSNKSVESIINFNPYLLTALPFAVDYNDIYPLYPDTDRDVNAYFFQYELTMSENFNVLLGGRYDDYSDVGGQFTPRAAFILKNEVQALKLLYSEGYRVGYFNEMYVNSPFLAGNEDIDPETVKNYELNYSRSVNDSFGFSVTVFHCKQEDLFTFVPNAIGVGYTSENYENFDITGVEAECTLQIRNCKFFLNAYYSDLDSKEDNLHSDFDSSAINFGADVILTPNLTFYFSFKSWSGVDRELWEPAESVDDGSDLNLAFHYNKANWSVNLSAYNVLNTDDNEYNSGNYYSSALTRPETTYAINVKRKFG